MATKSAVTSASSAEDKIDGVVGAIYNGSIVFGLILIKCMHILPWWLFVVAIGIFLSRLFSELSNVWLKLSWLHAGIAKAGFYLLIGVLCWSLRFKGHYLSPSFLLFLLGWGSFSMAWLTREDYFANRIRDWVYSRLRHWHLDGESLAEHAFGSRNGKRR